MPENETPPFRIRPARVTDAAEIARLAGELGYPASQPDMQARLAEVLARPEHHVLVAESGGALLGWAAAEIRTLLVSGRKAELMGLVVATQARRLGVGKTLVEAIQRWGAEQGCDRLTVRSNVARTESHPFYERLGYARTKTQHVYLKRFGATRTEADRRE